MKIKIIARPLVGIFLFQISLPLIISLAIIPLATASLATAKNTPETIQVTASIPPIHSLLSQVMQGIATPNLLIKTSTSPHNYALKPSDIVQLQHQDLIFWVGADIENNLAKFMKPRKHNTAIALSNFSELTMLPWRHKTDFSWHTADEEAKSSRHAHNITRYNQHLWLDPDNAKIILTHMRDLLILIDPKNSKKYASNTLNALNEIDRLTTEIINILDSVKTSPPEILLFHDSIHYFENYFTLKTHGLILLNPHTPPSGKHLRNLLGKIDPHSCLFFEPQFSKKILIAFNNHNKNQEKPYHWVEIDPLGANLRPGIALYSQLMLNIAQSFADCSL